MIDLLGLPLEMALDVLRAMGDNPRIMITSSPRESAGGTLRVVRYSANPCELVAARFPDRARTED